MRALRPWFALSLVGNVVLAAVLILHEPATATATVHRAEPRSPHITGNDSRSTEAATTPTPAIVSEWWAALHHADLHALARHLRSAGFPEYSVRALIGAEIDERFRAREEALSPPRRPARYWEADPHPPPLDVRLAQLNLRREKATLRAAVLGESASAPKRDDGLPAEKREVVSIIIEDYDAMIQELQQPHWGMTLPSERALLDSLKEEKRRELLEVLTPAELAEYEFRTSEQVRGLRMRLRGLEPTEEEFRAIASHHTAFETNVGSLNRIHDRPQPGEDPAAFGERIRKASETRRTAEQQRDAEIKAALGEERFQRYEISGDAEMQQFGAVLDRVGEPLTLLDELFALREETLSAVNRIGSDTNVPAETRRAALRDLAQQFRRGVAELVPGEPRQAYLEHADNWLRDIEAGMIVEIRGGARSARGLP